MHTAGQDNSVTSTLLKNYLHFLLEGDRGKAADMILQAVEDGLSVKEIYLRVFQPAQHEIGRLWQNNVVSVAQEHYCTAVTQRIMSQLYPAIFSSTRNGWCLVAACVGGELHEIGIRMVADFFEMDGWDTYYLGANMETESLVDALRKYSAHILAISVSMTFHVPKVMELISAVRDSFPAGQIRILVGGRPFNLSAELWKSVGADGFAKDAESAIDTAHSLLEGAS